MDYFDLTLPEDEVRAISSIGLAHLGDAVYELLVRTWLCAIGRNCYLSHLRRNKPQANLDELQIPDPRKSMEEQLVDKTQALAIHRILHDLPEPYKEVFSLRVFGQLSFENIGSLFGRTANWACVTYHRARQKILAKLEE